MPLNQTPRDRFSSTKRAAQISGKAQAKFIMENLAHLRKVDTPGKKHEKAAKSFHVLLANGEELTPGQYSYLEGIYELVMGAAGFESVDRHIDRKLRQLKFG